MDQIRIAQEIIARRTKAFAERTSAYRILNLNNPNVVQHLLQADNDGWIDNFEENMVNGYKERLQWEDSNFNMPVPLSVANHVFYSYDMCGHRINTVMIPSQIFREEDPTVFNFNLLPYMVIISVPSDNVIESVVEKFHTQYNKVYPVPRGLCSFCPMTMVNNDQMAVPNYKLDIGCNNLFSMQTEKPKPQMVKIWNRNEILENVPRFTTQERNLPPNVLLDYCPTILEIGAKEIDSEAKVDKTADVVPVVISKDARNNDIEEKEEISKNDDDTKESEKKDAPKSDGNVVSNIKLPVLEQILEPSTEIQSIPSTEKCGNTPGKKEALEVNVELLDKSCYSSPGNHEQKSTIQKSTFVKETGSTKGQGASTDNSKKIIETNDQLIENENASKVSEKVVNRKDQSSRVDVKQSSTILEENKENALSESARDQEKIEVPPTKDTPNNKNKSNGEMDKKENTSKTTTKILGTVNLPNTVESRSKVQAKNSEKQTGSTKGQEKTSTKNSEKMINRNDQLIENENVSKGSEKLVNKKDQSRSAYHKQSLATLEENKENVYFESARDQENFEVHLTTNTPKNKSKSNGEMDKKENISKTSSKILGTNNQPSPVDSKSKIQMKNLEKQTEEVEPTWSSVVKRPGKENVLCESKKVNCAQSKSPIVQKNVPEKIPQPAQKSAPNVADNKPVKQVRKDDWISVHNEKQVQNESVQKRAKEMENLEQYLQCSSVEQKNEPVVEEVVIPKMSNKQRKREEYAKMLEEKQLRKAEKLKKKEEAKKKEEEDNAVLLEAMTHSQKEHIVADVEQHNLSLGNLLRAVMEWEKDNKVTPEEAATIGLEFARQRMEETRGIEFLQYAFNAYESISNEMPDSSVANFLYFLSCHRQDQLFGAYEIVFMDIFEYTK